MKQVKPAWGCRRLGKRNLIIWKYSGNRNVPIRDKQGQLLTSENGQEARWVEHFKEVLNRPAPEEEPDRYTRSWGDLSVDTGPPKKEEIIAAINSLRNHKAPGKDRLNAELFEADAVTTPSILQPLFTTICYRRKIPDVGIRVSSSRYQRCYHCFL